MQIGILYNPRSGALKAFSYASSLSVYFTSKGEQVRIRESSRQYKKSDVESFFKSLDALIVVGGDGTFRTLLPMLSSAKIPVTLFPAGNESLVARQFGIERSIPDLYDKLKKGAYEAHYFAYIDDTPFFLMASAGLDSAIVKEVDLRRTKGSSLFSYLLGGFKALRSYREPEGELFFNEDLYPPEIVFKGSFVIANSSQYARNFNPVPEASSQAPFFAIRVYHNVGKAQFMYSCISSFLTKKPISINGSDIYYPKEGKIIFDKKTPVQVDGDYIGDYEELSFRKSSSKILFIA